MMRLLMSLMLLMCFVHVQGIRVVLLILNHKSHVMYFGQLAKALAASGDDVTAIIGSRMPVMPELQQIERVTWMTYKMADPPVAHADEQADSVLRAYVEGGSILEKIRVVKGLADLMTEETLQMCDGETMEKLASMKFDFAVVDGAVPVGLHVPYRLGIPFATFTVEIDPTISRAPWYPSYVPPFITGYSDRMTFPQRIISFIFFYLKPLLLLVAPDKGIENSPRCVPDKPPASYIHLLSQASLFFTLRLPTLHFPRGAMPNSLELGGIMGRPANLSAIPSRIADFLHQAPGAVILVSFGSWLDKLPAAILDKLLAAFSACSEYHFIWRLSPAARLLPVPHNVLYTDWMPQNDLLGHPKVIAFVTHCGISGIIETVYHGVPIVGFPLGLDQAPNARLMEQREFGIILDINTFSSEHLVSALRDVIRGGNVYRRNIQRAAAILRDLPPAGNAASFWINHVVRHGSEHVRSAAAHELAWYEYLCLDVAVVLGVTGALAGKLLGMCCSRGGAWASRKCRRGNQKQEASKKEE